MLMNDNEIKALISLLDDDDTEVATHVEGRIREMGNTIIPFLETEWEGSFDPFLQKRLEELIHDLQYTAVLERLATWKEGGAMVFGLWRLTNTRICLSTSFGRILSNFIMMPG